MCDLRFASAGLRTWLVTGLLVALSGCASGAGGGHPRPHAARDTAIPKLEARPPMVARDEVAMAFPDEAGGVDSQPDDRVEEIVVTGARRETSACARARRGGGAAGCRRGGRLRRTRGRGCSRRWTGFWRGCLWGTRRSGCRRR